jgi:hypothetical protein
MEERKIWFVYIEIPKELLDDIKEGSIDLAGQTIDLEDIDNAYDKDLEKTTDDAENEGVQADTTGAQVDTNVTM